MKLLSFSFPKGKEKKKNSKWHSEEMQESSLAAALLSQEQRGAVRGSTPGPGCPVPASTAAICRLLVLVPRVSGVPGQAWAQQKGSSGQVDVAGAGSRSTPVLGLLARGENSSVVWKGGGEAGRKQGRGNVGRSSEWGGLKWRDGEEGQGQPTRGGRCQPSEVSTDLAPCTSCTARGAQLCLPGVCMLQGRGAEQMPLDGACVRSSCPCFGAAQGRSVQGDAVPALVRLVPAPRAISQCKQQS